MMMRMMMMISSSDPLFYSLLRNMRGLHWRSALVIIAHGCKSKVRHNHFFLLLFLFPVQRPQKFPKGPKNSRRQCLRRNHFRMIFFLGGGGGTFYASPTPCVHIWHFLPVLRRPPLTECRELKASDPDSDTCESVSVPDRSAALLCDL